jgi:hypothetical protein
MTIYRCLVIDGLEFDIMFVKVVDGIVEVRL